MSERDRLAAQAEATNLANDARALMQRVDEGQFFVACLGQFKRGKSTVIKCTGGRAPVAERRCSRDVGGQDDSLRGPSRSSANRCWRLARISR